MKQNKGKILYDSSIMEEVREWHKMLKKDQLTKGIIGIIFAVFVFIILILPRDPSTLTKEQTGASYILVLIALPILLIYGIGGIVYSKNIHFLKVYENGIELPYTKFIIIKKFLKIENFIPFDQIEEIYSNHGEDIPLGGKPNPPYIYIKLKGRLRGTEAIHINDIGGKEHLDKFVKIVENKVEKVNIRW